jgi:hypothetical protein
MTYIGKVEKLGSSSQNFLSHVFHVSLIYSHLSLAFPFLFHLLALLHFNLSFVIYFSV